MSEKPVTREGIENSSSSDRIDRERLVKRSSLVGIQIVYRSVLGHFDLCSTYIRSFPDQRQPVRYVLKINSTNARSLHDHCDFYILFIPDQLDQYPISTRPHSTIFRSLLGHTRVNMTATRFS